MSLLLEVVTRNGLIFDAIGVIGLGLIGLAAVRLSSRHKSWGGQMMALGAISLLLARLYIMLRPHFMSFEVEEALGRVGLTLTEGLPPILLTFGLAGIVWGLWGHERWLKETR